MANLFLTRKLSNLTKSSTRIRRLSSFNKNQTKIGFLNHQSENDELNIWSENNWSSIGKQFNKTIKFPLPGQTGFTANSKSIPNNFCTQQQLKQNNNLLSEKEQETLKFDLFYRPQSYEKQFDTYIQALNYKKNMEINEYVSDEVNLDEMKNSLELKAFKCPQSLVKDFQTYFPTTHTALTVITVSIKTENDMATFNNDVEVEREILMKKFIDVAQNVCSKIRKQGYWVDFIDPSSGRPHNGEFTYATFFETDERYRKFGFEIIDYGCCKVISHHKWGTKSYVGSILTTASHESKFIQEVTKNI